MKVDHPATIYNWQECTAQDLSLTPEQLARFRELMGRAETYPDGLSGYIDEVCMKRSWPVLTCVVYAIADWIRGTPLLTGVSLIQPSKHAEID